MKTSNLIEYYPGSLVKTSEGYVPASNEDTLDYLAIMTPDFLRKKIFDHDMQLRRMELKNPSLSNLENGTYDKIGVDFKINQPIHKLRE